MKRFLFQTSEYELFFFVCIGDECDMCNRCKVRFSCYTGEIFQASENNYAGDRVHNLEIGIFGEINHKLFYDNETHDKYYHVTSGKWDRSYCYRTRCVAQFG